MELCWSDSDCEEYVPLRLDRRFRLRTAMLFFTLLCLLFAALGLSIRRAQAQEWAYAEIARRGGTIFIDGDRVRVAFLVMPSDMSGFRCRVIRGQVGSTPFSDRDIPLLTSVRGLVYVDFAGSRVTRDGVLQLQQELPGCRAELVGTYPWSSLWSSWRGC